MTTSSEPLITPEFLASVAKLKYRVTTRDSEANEVGVLVDRPAHKQLLVEGAEGAAPRWTLGVSSGGIRAHLISRDTYDVLRQGTVGADGLTISYEGKNYRIRVRQDQQQFIAEAVKA